MDFKPLQLANFAARYSLFLLPTLCSLPIVFSAAHPLQLAIRLFCCLPLQLANRFSSCPPFAARHSLFLLPTPCSLPIGFPAAHPLQLAIRFFCCLPMQLVNRFSAAHPLQLATRFFCCLPLAACPSFLASIGFVNMCTKPRTPLKVLPPQQPGTWGVWP